VDRKREEERRTKTAFQMIGAANKEVIAFLYIIL